MEFVLGTKELTAETWATFLSDLDSLHKANEWEASAKDTLTAAGFLK